MWTTRQAIFFAPLLLSITMGATDCEYFSTTVVPLTDPTPPTTWDGVWKGAEYQILRSSGNPGFTYHISPGETVFAISSAIDDGGLYKLTMSPDSGWTCCQGNICSGSSGLSAAIIDTQPGTVGSTVSTGIWDYVEVRLPSCNLGYTLVGYQFKWTTQGQNFHGGKTTSATHKIVYP